MSQECPTNVLEFVLPVTGVGSGIGITPGSTFQRTTVLASLNAQFVSETRQAQKFLTLTSSWSVFWTNVTATAWQELGSKSVQQIAQKSSHRLPPQDFPARVSFRVFARGVAYECCVSIHVHTSNVFLHWGSCR